MIQDFLQDLSRKENTAPSAATAIGSTIGALCTAEIQRSFQRSILNGNRDETKVGGGGGPGSRRKRLSVSEVSDMLFEFYKTKSAKVPKQYQLECQNAIDPVMMGGKYGQISPTSAETPEPSSIAAIAVYGSASETASKNLPGDEMMPTEQQQQHKDHHVSSAAVAASFHPRVKYTLPTIAAPTKLCGVGTVTAIPTSVLVSNTASIVQPPPPPPPPQSANLERKPQAAVIAEALMRNGLHSFQQQLRAQEILRQTQGLQTSSRHDDNNIIGNNDTDNDNTTTKILENLLRKQRERDFRHSECENEPSSSTEDEEDDGRYPAFDDIHLVEQSAIGGGGPGGGGNKYANGNSLSLFASGSSPMLEAQAHALRNFEFTLSDYGGSNSNCSTTSPNGLLGENGEPVYECRHCGKKYRWKSTLRRHENVECGGKEPSHQCPYCPYKSKQRGNLGVHVRKHHGDLPQLPSKRRSKYTLKMCEGGNLTINGSLSDDSQGKLIIDCNK